MLESKRPLNPTFSKRPLRGKLPAVGFESLVRKSVREDIQRRFRQILCEAVQYPGDAEWLSEAIEDVIRHAHAAAGYPPERVLVHQDGGDVLLSDPERSLRLIYRGLWRLHEDDSDDLHDLAEALSAWKAFD